MEVPLLMQGGPNTSNLSEEKRGLIFNRYVGMAKSFQELSAHGADATPKGAKEA